MGAERGYVFADRKIRGLLYIFLAGVVAGTLLVNYQGINEKTRLAVYSDYMMHRLDTEKVDHVALFRFILLNRSREFMILVLAGMTRYRYVLHAGYIGYQGIKWSALLCMITIVKGLRAVLIFLSLLLPQFPVYFYLICYVIGISDFDQRYRIKDKVGIFLKIMGLIVLMSILEAFVNPILV